MITAFYDVFENKLLKLKKQLKDLLASPKKERDKNKIKMVLKEAKELKKTLKKIKNETGHVCCPNCGHEV